MAEQGSASGKAGELDRLVFVAPTRDERAPTGIRVYSAAEASPEALRALRDELRDVSDRAFTRSSATPSAQAGASDLAVDSYQSWWAELMATGLESAVVNPDRAPQELARLELGSFPDTKLAGEFADGFLYLHDFPDIGEATSAHAAKVLSEHIRGVAAQARPGQGAEAFAASVERHEPLLEAAAANADDAETAKTLQILLDEPASLVPVTPRASRPMPRAAVVGRLDAAGPPRPGPGPAGPNQKR